MLTHAEIREKGFLQQYLIKCCYWYYVKSDPLISDREYDRRFHRLQELEEKSDTSFIDPKSPTQKIWGDREEQYPEWVKENRSLHWEDPV
jgi:NAD-dependent DNA ligase